MAHSHPAVLMRLVYAIAALMLLPGCTGALLRLSLEAPQANDYPSALAAEYLAYAQSEAEQGHIAAAEYFAAKGLQASNAEPVEAEVPAIDSAAGKARSDLVNLQTDDMKRVAPQKMARAQLLYDCWARQQSTPENEQAPCEEEFRSTLTELQMIADSFVYGQETVHMFVFPAHSARLGEALRAQASEIAGRASCITSYALEIHTGGTGKALALSKKRAQSLRAAFIGQGVPPERVRIAEDSDGKAVHLSNDEDSPGPNEVKVIMRSFGMVGL